MKYLTILLLLLHSPLKSMTFHTIVNGYWNDTMVWAGHVVPPNTMSDTFIISDSILLDSGLVFNHCYVLIDSSGGLCGHYTVSFINGSLWNNYGIMEADSILVLSGSDANNFSYGRIIFSRIITFSGSGTHGDFTGYVCGCIWDTCFVPIIPPPPDTNTYPNSSSPPEIVCSITLNPTYGEGNFTVAYTQSIQSSFLLFDDTGRKIYASELTGTAGNQSFYLNYLSNGLYLWEVINDNGICNKGKIMVAK